MSAFRIILPSDQKSKHMSSIFKRIVCIIAIVTALLFFSLIGAAWYLGAFSSVETSTIHRPVQYFIAAPDSGNYEQALGALNQLKAYLESTSLAVGLPAVMLYDDPMVRPLPKVSTRAAYLLADSVKIDPPNVFLSVPSGNAVSAVIDANPAIAPYKTYPAIREWCERHHLTPDTTGVIIEFYHPDGTIRVEFPVM